MHSGIYQSIFTNVRFVEEHLLLSRKEGLQSDDNGNLDPGQSLYRVWGVKTQKLFDFLMSLRPLNDLHWDRKIYIPGLRS